MRRWLVLGLVFAVVAAIVGVLGVVTPSWAHSEHPEAVASGVSAWRAPLESLELVGSVLKAAPESPALLWTLLAAALLAFTLGRRRSRRVIAVVVVLLLAVLSYEEGLHSVHHLSGQAKLVRCPTAAATAHLSATAVDTAASADVVLPAVALTIEHTHAAPVTRFLSPDQGRAPPSPTA